MEIAAGTELKDVLGKVLAAIPQGFVFDEEYIIERMGAEYPAKYLKFCALYTGRDESMAKARDAIRAAIEAFEGILVEEQELNVHFPTLYGPLSNRKIWKKI